MKKEGEKILEKEGLLDLFKRNEVNSTWHISDYFVKRKIVCNQNFFFNEKPLVG